MIMQNKTKGYVYIVKLHEYYKIGISINPSERLQSMRTDNPYDLEVIALFITDNMRFTEKYLHTRFELYRHRLEWFILPDNEVEWIQSINVLDNIMERVDISLAIKDRVAVKKDVKIRTGYYGKTSVFRSPEGVRTVITNISEFCRDNALTVNGMIKVSLGKASHHRGWTNPDYDKIFGR